MQTNNHWGLLKNKHQRPRPLMMMSDDNTNNGNIQKGHDDGETKKTQNSKEIRKNFTT